MTFLVFTTTSTCLFTEMAGTGTGSNKQLTNMEVKGVSAFIEYPQPLTSFWERLVGEIDHDLQSASDDASQFLQLCKKKCSSLQQPLHNPDSKPDALKSALQDTAHVVLDYTYLDETLLVEEEFPPESATQRLSNIQEHLDKIFQIAKECFEDQEVVEILGEEIVECVYWRKGALHYMYCHTLESSGRRLDQCHYKQKFETEGGVAGVQCLQEGVCLLEKMLSTRRPIALDTDVNSDDTLQLFSQGVYSDTHLLAMMYGGELCYWHQQAEDKGFFTRQVTGDSATFCPRQHGLCLLQSYLRAVRGPLKGHGWNASRAEEFVQYFQQKS